MSADPMEKWMPGPLNRAIADLYPGYFALVMATGIVSVVFSGVGQQFPAVLFSIIAIGAAAVLCSALALRIVFHRRRFVADFADHWRSPGYFTLPAAALVLGIDCQLVLHNVGAAASMWFVGLLLWFIVTYAFFPIVILRPTKPAIGNGVNGAWFIFVVSTQGVAILGSLLARGHAFDPKVASFVSLAFFLVGLLLYIWIGAVVLLRLLFSSVETSELGPSYWVAMGALAITCLAGLRVRGLDTQLPGIAECRGFLLATATLAWAGATWWIPHLAAFGYWRHIFRRHPLQYDPRFWSIVFPLGMYSVATRYLSVAWGIGPLMQLSRIAAAGAIAAWSVTLVSMLWSWKAAWGSAKPMLLPSGGDSDPAS